MALVAIPGSVVATRPGSACYGRGRIVKCDAATAIAGPVAAGLSVAGEHLGVEVGALLVPGCWVVDAVAEVLDAHGRRPRRPVGQFDVVLGGRSGQCGVDGV